jgi:hypothetical protein
VGFDEQYIYIHAVIGCYTNSCDSDESWERGIDRSYQVLNGPFKLEMREKGEGRAYWKGTSTVLVKAR